MARGARTQNEVALACGVSQPTVHAWEADEKSPRADKLAKVAEVYGLGVDELLPRGRAA